MQINPISNQNANFRGHFLENNAWASIKRAANHGSVFNESNLRARTAIKEFEPYIELIKNYCPATSFYQISAPGAVDKMENIVFNMYRNGRLLASSKYENISSLFDKVKDTIAKDSVGQLNW